MIKHSMICDHFFNDPYTAKKMILDSPMEDHTASDGVTYPGIVKLMNTLEWDVCGKFEQMFGDRFKVKLMFARHSTVRMQPPHWAHSDMNMAQYVAMIYLGDEGGRSQGGTYCVRHRETLLETHPSNEEEMNILLRDGNKRSSWDITYKCPEVFNRLFILNAYYLHAAAASYGSNRDNSRLVLSVFFDLD